MPLQSTLSISITTPLLSTLSISYTVQLTVADLYISYVNIYITPLRHYAIIIADMLRQLPIDILPHIGVSLITLIALGSHIDCTHSTSLLLVIAVLSVLCLNLPIFTFLGVISLVELLSIFSHFSGDELFSIQMLLSSVSVTVVGMSFYQMPQYNSLLLAVLILNMEIIAISSPAASDSALSLLLVIVVALYFRAVDLKMCPQECCLLFGTISAATTPTINALLFGYSNSSEHTKNHPLRLVVTITTIGVIATILLGVILGCVYTALDRCLQHTSSRVKMVIQSILFCCTAGGLVFGGMFPIMQTAISVYHLDFQHPLEWYA